MKTLQAEFFSDSLSAQIDDLIKQAIARKIGEGWTLESLSGRIARHVCLDQRKEVFSLDGKNILVLHAPRIEHNLGGTGGAYKIVQHYQFLN